MSSTTAHICLRIQTSMFQTGFPGLKNHQSICPKPRNFHRNRSLASALCHYPRGRRDRVILLLSQLWEAPLPKLENTGDPSLGCLTSLALHSLPFTQQIRSFQINGFNQNVLFTSLCASAIPQSGDVRPRRFLSSKSLCTHHHRNWSTEHLTCKVLSLRQIRQAACAMKTSWTGPSSADIEQLH